MGISESHPTFWRQTIQRRSSHIGPRINGGEVINNLIFVISQKGDLRQRREDICIAMPNDMLKGESD